MNTLRAFGWFLRGLYAICVLALVEFLEPKLKEVRKWCEEQFPRVSEKLK